MVSDASHELRTPLAALQAQLELAHLSEGDPTALKADLEQAEHSVDRLARLTTNLLVLSALEAGQDAQSAPWSAIVAEFGAASDRARLLALHKDISVAFDVDDTDDPSHYRISTMNFSQVIDNLVGNSLRAVPKSGEVHAHLTRETGGIRLTVEDSGPGMPEDFLPVAFDRFSRPDTHRSDATGGSGLGLAIVAAIVSTADGQVQLANRPAGGFTVTVTIPQAPTRVSGNGSGPSEGPLTG